jgi:hypothetical protein
MKQAPHLRSMRGPLVGPEYIDTCFELFHLFYFFDRQKHVGHEFPKTLQSPAPDLPSYSLVSRIRIPDRICQFVWKWGAALRVLRRKSIGDIWSCLRRLIMASIFLASQAVQERMVLQDRGQKLDTLRLMKRLVCFRRPERHHLIFKLRAHVPKISRDKTVCLQQKSSPQSLVYADKVATSPFTEVKGAAGLFFTNFFLHKISSLHRPL